MKSVPAIAFEYRPSRWLLLASASIAVLALVSIALCGLNVWLRLGLMALALIYSAHSLRRFFASPAARLVWHSAGHWRLREASEREQTGELVRSVVLGAMMVLVLRFGAKETRSFVLLPDNSDGETRRRLRVRLARAESFVGSMN